VPTFRSLLARPVYNPARARPRRKAGAFFQCAKSMKKPTPIMIMMIATITKEDRALYAR
jgi:hypothetical protein